MKFSIVTVALNAADDLPLTIESVLQQSFKDYEYIVIDGGSWDDTPAVLAPYKDSISRVVRIEDAGIFAAMNDALEFCSGDYVLFLNAKDRFYSSEVLSTIAAAMRDDADVVFGDHVYVNGRRHHLHKAARFDLTFHALEAGDVDHRWHSRIPGHQATFTRISLLRRLRYDTRLEICADHDFMFRAFAQGASFQHIDETVCHYMAGGFSALRSERLRQEFSRTYRKFSRKPAVVDRLFYGESLSPFARHTPKTGLPLTGVGSSEGPYPDLGIPTQISWCSGKGFEFVSPNDAESIGCSIGLFNVFPDQTVIIRCGEQDLAEFAIPLGYASFDVGFLTAVPPSSHILVSTSRRGRLSPGDDRFVSVALGPLTFNRLPNPGLGNSYDAALGVGSYRVKELGPDFEAMFLTSGWGDVNGDHVRSLGSASIIALRVQKQVSEISLQLSGDPHLNSEMRGVILRINGVRHDSVMLEAVATTTRFKIPPAASSSTDRVVVIRLEPLLTDTLSLESREPGVCLFAIDLT
ncbi:glycosyltransferase family 2 protein [Sphingomonas glacialis]|uniref:Glycosyltransferase n=1 Tax=Sphingomonas glacialis TaxID=658225 RepID=A0A502FQ93_9SPHN|nr:glycosyltransferase family 2 protein [Sphingomonas glacialis]TPG51615.1 glycosyltransferase [Sphingomonas glacialis]